MDKVELKKMLEEGFSYRKIAKHMNCSASKVKYWVNQYELKSSSAYNKLYQNDVDHNFFRKIDTPEKAYMVGFILGDGYINERFDVSLGVAIADRQIIEDITNYLPWEINISDSYVLNKKTKRFPKTRTCIRSRNIGKDLVKHFGHRLASKRHTPRISKALEPYLVAGFFDGDGCITWGYRKDRNRLWHKVNFTASDTILIGIQNILIKNDISSFLRPKTNENCYVLEFSKRESIEKMYQYLPKDGIRLKRKVTKYNDLINKIKSPLRPESDENGGKSETTNTVPSLTSE